MGDLNIFAVLASLLNFLIVFFVFKYFLGEKIVAVIEARKQSVKASEEADDIAKKKIEETEKEIENMLDDARKKALEIEKRAEDLSKQNSNKIIEKAEQEAKYIFDSAKNQIEKDRLDMENNMKDKILDLSLKLNSKIFNKETANKDFMDKEYDLLVK